MLLLLLLPSMGLLACNTKLYAPKKNRPIEISYVKLIGSRKDSRIFFKN